MGFPDIDLPRVLNAQILYTFDVWAFNFLNCFQNIAEDIIDRKHRLTLKFAMALTFINVSNRPFREGSEFSSTELVTFLELMETEFDRNYDAMKIINALENKSLPSRAYTRLTKMYEDGEPFVKILTKAFGYCVYSSLVYALYECGYSELADKMNHFIGARGNDVTFDARADIVSKTDGSHSSALALYYSLKRNVDNATFLDKKEFL